MKNLIELWTVEKVYHLDNNIFLPSVALKGQELLIEAGNWQIIQPIFAKDNMRKCANYPAQTLFVQKDN